MTQTRDGFLHEIGGPFHTGTLPDRMQQNNVKAFWAKGDGVADDTLAIQAAIDAADAQGDRTVFFPSGLYNISATLNLPPHVCLLGGHGMANLFGTGGVTGQSFAGLRWVGAASGIMVQISNPSSNTNYQFIERLAFLGNQLAATAVKYPNTTGIDFGTEIRDCRFKELTGDALIYAGFDLADNLHIRGARFDQIGGYAIHLHTPSGFGGGIFSMDKFFWQPGATGAETVGGLLKVTADAAQNLFDFIIHLSNGQAEWNCATTLTGAINLETNGSTTRNQFTVLMTNVNWIITGAAGAGHVIVRPTVTGDNLTFTAVNVNAGGIPILGNTTTSPAHTSPKGVRLPLYIFAPNDATVQSTDPASIKIIGNTISTRFTGASVGNYAPGTLSLADGQYTVMADHLTLNNSESLTLNGTACLAII